MNMMSSNPVFAPNLHFLKNKLCQISKKITRLHPHKPFY